MLSQCTLKNIRVNKNTTIIFPQWTSQSHAPKTLIVERQRYKTALMKHELGHAKFGELAQIEIESTLQNLPPANTCDEMDKQANKAAYAILYKYQRKDKRYDKVTDHGHTQGALLNNNLLGLRISPLKYLLFQKHF